MMNYSEAVVAFPCENEQLVGIVSTPATASACGVVIVVGGPQYRAGSHRQFVLLARTLAAQGITTLRFDYRGMGDSSGALRDFTAIESDLRAAVDALQQISPIVTRVFLWGLCDAASASLFYANSDQLICGLVMANPWARTEAGEAKALLNHYYGSRIFDASLWKKILSGQFNYWGSVQSFWTIFRKAVLKIESSKVKNSLPLREKMFDSWSQFRGDVLLFISGEDMTAREFGDMVLASSEWQALLDNPRVTKHDMPTANHTFSREAWRDEVAAVTAKWIIARSNNQA